jgi:DNA-binding response OmpR family regulator
MERAQRDRWLVSATYLQASPGQTPLPSSHVKQRRETQSDLRVLIVDDEIDRRNPLMKSLSLEGFATDCVQTGADALAAVQRASYDAIVLDLHLRDMLGLTVLSAWRRGDAALPAPIVTITGWYLDDGHEKASAALGAAAFLRKPLDSSVLADTLRRVIAAHGGEPPRAPIPARDSGSSAGRFHVEPVRMCDTAGERLRAMHERAVCGDDAAVDQIVADLLPVLRQRLRARFATAADEMIHDAVVDALMEYRTHPTRYDPTRGVQVADYLLFAARRDLLNRFDAERRRAAHEETTPDGALPEPPTPAPDDIPCSGRSSTIALRHVAVTEAERTVFRLWRRGERRTSAYASALRLGALPISEQRVRVNRIKDRVVRRIRRFAKVHRPL